MKYDTIYNGCHILLLFLFDALVYITVNFYQRLLFKSFVRLLPSQLKVKISPEGVPDVLDGESSQFIVSNPQLASLHNALRDIKAFALHVLRVHTMYTIDTAIRIRQISHNSTEHTHSIEVISHSSLQSVHRKRFVRYLVFDS